jgi:3-isopropylmalate dehydrogenase
MKILVLPCDGIGPEIVAASMTVLEVTSDRFGLGLAFDYDDVGFTSLEKHGTTLRESVLEKAGATSPPASGSASTSTPTSAPPGRGRSSSRT